MFKVLTVDGPNVVTDQGCFGLVGFAYADGGRTRPIDAATFVRLRTLVLAAPELLAAAQATLARLALLGLSFQPEIQQLRQAVDRALKATPGRQLDPETLEAR